MTYPHSVVLIVAAEDRDEAEAFGVLLGHSGQEYRVPLSPDGAEPASHYGLHCFASDAFLEVIDGTAPGIEPAALSRLAAIVTSSVRTDSAGHFNDAAMATGLMRIVPPLPEDP